MTLDEVAIKGIALYSCTNSDNRFRLDFNVSSNKVECFPTILSLRLPDKSNVINKV